MDYDTWKTTDPSADAAECEDCGTVCDQPCDLEGRLLCRPCFELYDPELD